MESKVAPSPPAVSALVCGLDAAGGNLVRPAATSVINVETVFGARRRKNQKTGAFGTFQMN